jgi:16S rRNA (adenine1518-N6/adenine1519-N6)-dimethyltransferase
MQKKIISLDVPGLLKSYGLRPEKSLGQNFLSDEQVLERIAAAAEIQPDEVVLEIGPGLGSLTRRLSELARQVICVEVDANLLPPLRFVLQDYANVQVVQGDILSLDIAALMSQASATTPPVYQVVANIPYYITSALIRRLLEAKYPPHRLVLTVQREVAERICAAPGDLSLLALSVQVYGNPRVAARIPAGAFYPPPKVDSAVIRVDRYAQPLVPVAQLPLFFRLAKAGFSQKRKTLRNALSGGLGWPAERAGDLLHMAGIDPQRRAETLSIDEWRRLAEAAGSLPPQPE